MFGYLCLSAIYLSMALSTISGKVLADRCIPDGIFAKDLIVIGSKGPREEGKMCTASQAAWVYTNVINPNYPAAGREAEGGSREKGEVHRLTGRTN